jgi:hypothetical protein
MWKVVQSCGTLFIYVEVVQSGGKLFSRVENYSVVWKVVLSCGKLLCHVESCSVMRKVVPVCGIFFVHSCPIKTTSSVSNIIIGRGTSHMASCGFVLYQ